jgi:hypothetical protein
VEYSNSNNCTWYRIQPVEVGQWTARIEEIASPGTKNTPPSLTAYPRSNADADSINGPAAGTSYTLMTFYSTSVTLEVATADGRDSYNPRENVTIVANLANASVPITGASVRAEIRSPNGTTTTLILYDDRTHNDAVANDGKYTNTYPLSMTGRYDITVTAKKTTPETLERMAFLMLWVSPAAQTNVPARVWRQY